MKKNNKYQIALFEIIGFILIFSFTMTIFYNTQQTAFTGEINIKEGNANIEIESEDNKLVQYTIYSFFTTIIILAIINLIALIIKLKYKKEY